MLTFNKAEIVDVLEQASRWTCRNFVYTDEIARGKITLLSKTPVTAEEAYAAFLVALNTNNIAIYPTGRYYKLIRTADAKKNPIPLYTDPESGTPANEQPITRVIRLQYADADQMRGIVANFVSPQGADVVAIPPDMLIITDIGLNLRRIERILDSVDRQGGGDLVRIVQIRYAAAKDIADKVNQIFQAQGRPGAGKRTLLAPSQPATPAPVPGVPPGAAPAPGAAVSVSVSKIIPDDRTNKLIVIADEKSYQRIQELIDQLDVPATSGGGIHVVFLKNANAEEMAQTLSSLASGQRRTTTGGGAPAVPATGQPMRTPPVTPPAAAGAGAGSSTAELFSGEVKITADKTQNALLIQASGTDFQAVSRLIERLDRPRRQVFVEAVILEVNLRDQTQFGIGAHAAIPYTYKGDTAFIPLASEPGRVSSLNVGSAISLGGFLTGFVGPTSTEISKLGLNLPSLGLLIQALQTSSDVNVLSTPHLVATDNEESEITVGQNVPFQAGYSTGLSSLLTSATSTTASSSALGSLVGTGGLSSLYAPIQRQNVDLKLKIKPQISEGGRVRLQIEEQTEEIASNDATLGPTTSKRSVKTQVIARDQSTIVIGGLIQERTVRSIKKIPVLGSIPILGWLFRDTDTTKTKTNLLLFLTPYIIRDESDYRRIYERKRQEQQEFIEQFYGRQPRYEVPVDWARKAGPFARIHAGVVEESSRLENGGHGAPGQRVVAPPGDEGAPPPSPAPGGAPQGGVPPASPPPGAARPQPEGEGTPVDRLEPQPEVPTPGEPPAAPHGGDAPPPAQ
jgi:general secretion pathway protein D